MSLQQWHKNGWLRPYETSRKQIADLFDIVDRDLADASTARLSSDWQFGIAYNATLKLYTILLYAEAYRPDRGLAHYRTLQALPLILGDAKKADTDYLDSCRIKRNTVEYNMAGRTSPKEANELRADVLDWLRKNHPNLVNR